MPAFRPSLGTILRGHFWLLVVGLVVPIVAMLLGLLVDRLGDTLDHSVWEYAGQPARWMLFVIGIVITPMVLPVYVANGVTRRTVTAAAGTAGGLLSLAIAGYLAIGLLVERAIFDATGRQHTFADSHLFTTPGQVHLVVLQYTLVGAAYLAGGWLIGSGYYRFGGWTGTAILPLAVLPMVAMDLALGTGQLPVPVLREVRGDADLPVVGAIGLAAAVLVAAAVAIRALTRTVPLQLRRLQ